MFWVFDAMTVPLEAYLIDTFICVVIKPVVDILKINDLFVDITIHVLFAQPVEKVGLLVPPVLVALIS
jgi:hypothetical protein